MKNYSILRFYEDIRHSDFRYLNPNIKLLAKNICFVNFLKKGQYKLVVYFIVLSSNFCIVEIQLQFFNVTVI
jgi:hypothetical protein